jgi:hypothetical protein
VNCGIGARTESVAMVEAEISSLHLNLEVGQMRWLWLFYIGAFEILNWKYCPIILKLKMTFCKVNVFFVQ